MSVLIKGMVMPQNCDACPMLYEYRFCALTDNHASSIEWKMEEKRMPNCPLIELPDHGRLVDADDVIKESRCGYYWWETEQQVPQILNEIPTIIPAERSEDGRKPRSDCKC